MVDCILQLYQTDNPIKYQYKSIEWIYECDWWFLSREHLYSRILRIEKTKTMLKVFIVRPFLHRKWHLKIRSAKSFKHKSEWKTEEIIASNSCVCGKLALQLVTFLKVAAYLKLNLWFLEPQIKVSVNAMVSFYVLHPH